MKFRVFPKSSAQRANQESEVLKMSKLFSINWWISQFISVFMTMVFIYLIKIMLGKVNIPIASDIAESV